MSRIKIIPKKRKDKKLAKALQDLANNDAELNRKLEDTEREVFNSHMKSLIHGN